MATAGRNSTQLFEHLRAAIYLSRPQRERRMQLLQLVTQAESAYEEQRRDTAAAALDKINEAFEPQLRKAKLDDGADWRERNLHTHIPLAVTLVATSLGLQENLIRAITAFPGRRCNSSTSTCVPDPENTCYQFTGGGCGSW